MDTRDLHHALALTHWVMETLPISEEGNASPVTPPDDWERRWNAWAAWMEVSAPAPSPQRELVPVLRAWAQQLEHWLKEPPPNWRAAAATQAYRATFGTCVNNAVAREMRLLVTVMTTLRQVFRDETWTFRLDAKCTYDHASLPLRPSQMLPLFMLWVLDRIKEECPQWVPECWVTLNPEVILGSVLSWKRVDSALSMEEATAVGQRWALLIVDKMRHQGQGQCHLDLEPLYQHYLDQLEHAELVCHIGTQPSNEQCLDQWLLQLWGYDERLLWQWSAPASPPVAEGKGHIIVQEAPPPLGTSERQMLSEWVGQVIPLRTWPANDPLAALREEFPWAHQVLDRVSQWSNWAHRLGQTTLWLPPLLLVGQAGCGKTRLVQRLGEVLAVPTLMVSGAGALGGQVIQGTDRHWSNTMPSPILSFMHRHRVANPLIVVDEIDKAPVQSHLGSLQAALLPLLERENARCFVDPCLGVPCDLSAVSWLLTANDESVLMGPLRGRLDIVEMPHPRPEHLPAIVLGVRQDMARQWGVSLDRLPGWQDADTAWVRKQLGEGGLFSARQAKKLIEQRLLQPGPTLTVV